MKKTIKVLEEISNGFDGKLILSGFHHKSDEAMELKKYAKHLRKAIKVLKSVKKVETIKCNFKSKRNVPITHNIDVFVNAFEPIKEKP